MSRKTFSVSLNDRRPEEALLWARLDQATSESDLIKQALLAYLESGSKPSPITEQALNDLHARVAYLEQQLAGRAAPVAALQEEEPDRPGDPRELSEQFKAAVRKAARPGIRLDQ